MPFGISNVIMSKRALVFDLSHLYAGPNQVVLCQEFVYLQGSVTGDITGHTIFWEQTAGPVVILDDPGILNPSFVNPQSEDVEFRLYIDKGTPFELFDDIIVFRTPASVSQFSHGFTASSVEPLIVSTAPALDASFGEVGSYAIFWTPSTHTRYIGVEIQRWDVDEWVEVETQVKPLDSGTFVMQAGPPAYRVVSLWNSGNQYDDNITKIAEPGLYISTLDKSLYVIAYGRTDSTLQVSNGALIGGSFNLIHTGAITQVVETNSSVQLGIDTLGSEPDVNRVFITALGNDGSVETISTATLGIDVFLENLVVTRNNGISIG